MSVITRTLYHLHLCTVNVCYNLCLYCHILSSAPVMRDVFVFCYGFGLFTSVYILVSFVTCACMITSFVVICTCKTYFFFLCVSASFYIFSLAEHTHVFCYTPITLRPRIPRIAKNPGIHGFMAVS